VLISGAYSRRLWRKRSVNFRHVYDTYTRRELAAAYAITSTIFQMSVVPVFAVHFSNVFRFIMNYIYVDILD
jgi:hypothetical protein